MRLPELGSRRLFVREVAGTTASQSAALAASSVTAIVAARALGPGPYGAAAVSVALASVLTVLTSGYLSAAIVHFMPRTDPRSVSAAAVVLASLGGAASCLAVSGAAWGTDIVGASLVLPTAALAFVLAIDHALAAMIRGVGHPWRASAIDAAESVIVLVLVLALASDLSASTVVWCYLAGACASVATSAVLASAASGGVHFALDTALMSDMVRFGAPVWLGNAVQYANYRVDLLVLGAVASRSELGTYAVAVRLVELILVLPGAVALVVSPRSASLDLARLRVTTPRIYWATATLGLGAAVALAVAAPMIVNGFFGAEYAGSIALTRIMLPGLVAVGAAAVLAEELTQRGFARHNLAVAVSALLVAVVGWVVLIPQFGSTGAAWSTTVAYAVSGVATAAVFTKASEITARQFAAQLRWWSSAN